MMTAFEARTLTEMAKIANKAESIAILSTICDKAEEDIAEAILKGKNETYLSYPHEVLHSNFTISELRHFVKEYFGKYGYEVTAPTIEYKIRIKW